ncbi:MAG: hypothetical protein NZO16_01435 [Deltaproteobacteria bacterium]|nr:hypothetical protein [Deltaproteobacteria bacterium]
MRVTVRLSILLFVALVAEVIILDGPKNLNIKDPSLIWASNFIEYATTDFALVVSKKEKMLDPSKHYVGRLFVVEKDGTRKNFTVLVPPSVYLELETRLVTFGLFNNHVTPQSIKIVSDSMPRIETSSKIQAEIEEISEKNYRLTVRPIIEKLKEGEVLRETVLIKNSSLEKKVDVVGIFIN